GYFSNEKVSFHRDCSSVSANVSSDNGEDPADSTNSVTGLTFSDKSTFSVFFTFEARFFEAFARLVLAELAADVGTVVTLLPPPCRTFLARDEYGSSANGSPPPICPSDAASRLCTASSASPGNKIRRLRRGRGRRRRRGGNAFDKRYKRFHEFTTTKRI
ncbi:hypothetical protein HID58_047689, partial [Brassica napus]